MDTSAPPRLLLVDDEADLLISLRNVLARQGFETVGLTSGRDALTTLKEGSFDLLLTDLNMPEMDGIVLLRAALEIDPDLVAIILTGHGTVATAVETMKVGAFDYVLKPFQTSVLLPVLSRALEVRRLKRTARQLARQNEELSRQLEAERARAGSVQAELLPRHVPHLPGFELAGQCIPAREVGGDFYDWQEPSLGLMPLTLGDVMGKGMPAALLNATVRASLRAVAPQNPPAAALRLVRKAMAADFERTGSFVTLFHANLDISSRKLRYVDAGHGHAFVLRGSGMAESLTTGGPPLGCPFEDEYREECISLDPGDSLVVYSDGLVEVRPEAPTDRRIIADQLRCPMSAPVMVERLVGLAALTGTPPDDLTVLVLRCAE